MENLYDLIIEKLPRHPTETKHKIWVNGNEEIMCGTMDKANTIADLLEECGYDVVHTSCYNYKEDGLNFGWCAVYVDGM